MIKKNKTILDTNNRLFCKPVVPIKFEQSQHIIPHDVNDNNIIMQCKYLLLGIN